MRIQSWLLSFILLLMMTACGPATPTETDSNDNGDAAPNPVLETAPETTQPATENDVDVADPTQTPPPLPDSYPAPPTPAPPLEGYPAQPASAPTRNPYPGAYPGAEGVVWVLRPVGEQCADAQPDYDDLQDAVAALTAAGITVGDAEMTSLMVCSACGCPTSAHFRIQIDADDVAAAESLGWGQEQ